MANTLTAAIPQLLAQGLLALREMAIMPRLVNRGYESTPGTKGSTIDVPVPSAVTAVAVTPATTPPANADTALSKVSITLDQWYEAPFYLTDKEIEQTMDGVIPMQASEAVRALANNLDNALFAKYKGVYGYAGTAGTTPFASDLTAYTGARAALNNQLAPLPDRRVVIDPDAEANAINLRAFQDASFRGDRAGIIEGEIGRKLGADWYMDQNVPTHTKGTLSGTTGDGKALVNGAFAVGAKSIDLDDTSLTGTIVEGDVFTIAGDTQTYVCTGTKTAAANAISGLAFEPGLKAAPADNAVVTLKGSHAVNLLFHRDAFALATRPFADSSNVGGGLASFQSAVDPISGLALRLELSRQHKQWRWSYDILYGVQLVRRELAARIAG